VRKSREIGAEINQVSASISLKIDARHAFGGTPLLERLGYGVVSTKDCLNSLPPIRRELVHDDVDVSD
jgi:hypothetical protein